MTRTQLSFEAEDLRRARARASELGISLAEYVRRLVSEDLGGGPPGIGAEALFDLGSSAGSDISAHKDAMLADALAAHRR